MADLCSLSALAPTRAKHPFRRLGLERLRDEHLSVNLAFWTFLCIYWIAIVYVCIWTK